MVLVICLWLITILAVFGIGLARISWTAYHFARWKVNNFLALQSVNTVILMSKFERMADETPEYDTLYELTPESEYESENLKVVYSLIDEERKININKAPSLILKDLPSMDMDKAVEIVNSEYRPFSSKEELLLIEEIEKEDYDDIKDLITVYGEGQVNINTCSEEVLEALGVEEGVIASIMNFRKGEDDEEYTIDDGVFESPGGIIDTLTEDFFLTMKEQQTLLSLITKNMVGVKSANYKLKADVYVNDKLVDRYSVIIGRDNGAGKYHIREWRK